MVSLAEKADMVKTVGKSMKEQGNGFGGEFAGKREMQVFEMFFSPLCRSTRVFINSTFQK